MPCGCSQNADGLTVVFCRQCAINLSQGSDGWFRARAGKLTASKMGDALAGGKGITRAKYRAQLITERLTGFPCNGFHNEDTERGTRLESVAVNAYSLFANRDIIPAPVISETGFWQHLSIPDFGASPDRLVGDDGQLEVKSHVTHIHFAILLSETIPTSDLIQVLTGLACTGRRFCDYISFDLEAPSRYDLFVTRVYRDEYQVRISQLEREAEVFLAEVARDTALLQERCNAKGFINIKNNHQDTGLLQQLSGSLAMLEKPARRRRSTQR